MCLVENEQDNWIYSCAQKHGIERNQVEHLLDIEIIDTGFGFKRKISIIRKDNGNVLAIGRFSFRENVWKFICES